MHLALIDRAAESHGLVALVAGRDHGRQRFRRAVDAGFDLGQNALFPGKALHLPGPERDQDGTADQTEEKGAMKRMGSGGIRLFGWRIIYRLAPAGSMEGVAALVGAVGFHPPYAGSARWNVFDESQIPDMRTPGQGTGRCEDLAGVGWVKTHLP